MDLKRRLTGSKTASKAEVLEALERRYGRQEWPSPASVVEHAADALGACVAALDSPTVLLARRMVRAAGVAP